MTLPIIPPFAVKASYQNSQYATGTYTQGGSQVFSHLVTPPTSGVAAETTADDDAHALGFTAFSAANEVQLVTIVGGPTSGTFTLGWGAQVTSPIAYNATAATVRNALVALPSVPHGVTPVADVQTVTIGGGATAGTFTLTFGGQTTGAITYPATAATVQTAFLALSSVGAGNAVVTGASGGPYTITFGGTLLGPQGAVTGSAGSLTGGTPTLGVVHTTTGVAATYNLTVAGSAGGPYTITFITKLGNENVAQISGNGDNLVGGTNPHITVSTTTGGTGAFVNQAVQNAHQQFDVMRNFYDSASGNHF